MKRFKVGDSVTVNCSCAYCTESGISRAQGTVVLVGSSNCYLVKFSQGEKRALHADLLLSSAHNIEII